MGVTFNENVTIAANLTVSGSVSFGSGGILNVAIGAAAKIDADKLRQYLIYSTSQLGQAANDTLVMGPIRRKCIITKCSVAALTAPGATGTITVDFLVDGVSVLTGGTPIALTNANLTANRLALDLTLKPSTDAEMIIDPSSDDGFIEVVLAAAAGGGDLPDDLEFCLEATSNE